MTTHHHRRSIRLKDYDYAQNGAYFVTICAQEKRCIFGQVVDGVMVVNEWGQIVTQEWEQTAAVRSNVELDAFVVMPNHVHGILVITNDVGDTVGATRRVAPTSTTLQSGSLGAIIGQFKSAVTRAINRLPDAPDHPIWQRNYYEHIIRSEDTLNTIRAYVANNPAKWAEDSLYVS
jgi:REP element-mobilizing transposase RayT